MMRGVNNGSIQVPSPPVMQPDVHVPERRIIRCMCLLDLELRHHIFPTEIKLCQVLDQVDEVRSG